jgi:hypothetical protein
VSIAIERMPSPWGAGGHIVGEEVAARIRLEARRGRADLLHPVDERVVADVGGEVKFAAGLDKGDVGLALDDGLPVLFAAGLRQVAQVADRVRGGVV